MISSTAQFAVATVREALVGTARISRASATSIELGRGLIPLKVNGVWITRRNAAAVAKDTTGLSSSTVYYVYASDSGGSTIIEFSATAPTEDTDTGLRIKTGDATRTLVGMVRTNGSTQFVDTAALRFVISWFDQRRVSSVNAFTADRATTSTSFVELNTEIRAEFLVWSGRTVFAHIAGWSNNTANDQNTTAIGFDGTTAELVENRGRPGANTEIDCALTLDKTGLSEGYHYATLLAKVGANTGTWQGAATSDRCQLTVVVEG